MYFNMSSNIVFENENNQKFLGIASNIEIVKSIKNLADTAVINMPAFCMNKRIDYENNVIKRGSKVNIYLGYDENLKLEFKGYVREVITGESLRIECEDDLFIFRKDVKNKQFKPVTVKQVAKYICDQINSEIQVVCDFDLAYDKFIIHEATGFDVLKKLQEDTGSDVFFLSTQNELHIRAMYTNIPTLGAISFSPQANVEKINLEYQDTPDRKVQIVIKGTDLKGKYREIQYGNMSGEKFEFTMNTMPNESMEARAKMEFDRMMKPGYKGSIDGWLIPYVEPGHTVWYEDEDFPEQAGAYLAEATRVEFNENGGKRTIHFGIRLS